MILKKFFTANFYLQNTKTDIELNFDQLLSNSYIFSENFILTNYNNNSSLYKYLTSTINIPENFFRNDTNYQQYTSIEKLFNKRTLDFIIFHEIGHLNNHQFLSLDLNNLDSNNFTYIPLNSKSNYIKTDTSLDIILDRTLSKDNPIDDFIHMNFTESYADAYAGIISHIKDKDISIFDKIYQFRFDNLNKLKKHPEFNSKLNNSCLEISAGKFSTSRYHNLDNIMYIKDNIAKIFNHDTLQKMSFNNLHSLIQIESLHSLKDTILKEATNNILFNNDLNNFLNQKNITLVNYLQEFEKGLNNYKKNIIKNIIQEEIFNKSQNYLNSLMNFHSKNISFVQFNPQSSLLTLEEELQIFTYLSNLSQKNTLEQNTIKFKKFIISDFIFKNSDVSLFLNHLSANNQSNQKFNEIIKLIDPELANSLIKYNNLPNNITITPTVKSHNLKDIIATITENLSTKDKKQFLDYIEKHKIIKITTAYLSAPNANVTNDNEEKKQFLLKSKSEILSRIINIENKAPSHNQENYHEVKKLKK